MLTIKKWNPFSELSTLHREMDELFNKTFGAVGGFTRGLWKESSFVPNIDCFMKEGKCIVQCELPGVDPKDVDISIVGNQLTIRGEKKSSREVKEEEYLFNESFYGAFERSITLPEGVKTDNIRANYKNGILEISLPAEKAMLPKKVTVKVEGVGREESKKAA